MSLQPGIEGADRQNEALATLARKCERGVPRRRPSIADKKRCAARKRISKLASRRSSTANSEPPSGILGRQTRWRAPPSGRMPCHPSGPWRNSLPGSLVRSRLYCSPPPKEDASRSDKTVDKASGAQKIGCLSKAFCGSAAKREPPLQSKGLCRAGQTLCLPKALIISLVVGVTA